MGTRALVHIKDETRKTLVTLYRQMDGYPEGLGADILAALNGGDVTIVNGYHSNQHSPAIFNGMGCLAAYLVSRLKFAPYGRGDMNPIGNVYLYPANSKDCGEEYTYTVFLPKDSDQVHIKVIGWDPKAKPIYSGPLAGFIPFTERKVAE